MRSRASRRGLATALSWAGRQRRRGDARAARSTLMPARRAHPAGLARLGRSVRTIERGWFRIWRAISSPASPTCAPASPCSTRCARHPATSISRCARRGDHPPDDGPQVREPLHDMAREIEPVIAELDTPRSRIRRPRACAAASSGSCVRWARRTRCSRPRRPRRSIAARSRSPSSSSSWTRATSTRRNLASCWNHRRRAARHGPAGEAIPALRPRERRAALAVRARREQPPDGSNLRRRVGIAVPDRCACTTRRSWRAIEALAVRESLFARSGRRRHEHRQSR